MMKILSALLLSGLLATTPALAQDPGKGKRGPTTAQIDVRASYSDNVFTQQYLGKLWTGDKFGVWGLAGITIAQGTDDSGLESIIVLGGPRFRIGNLHALTFAGKSFSIKQHAEDTITAGIFASYDVRNNKGELTGSLQYLSPEKNSDSLFYGISYAESITEKLQLGAGFTATQSNESTSIDARLIARITPSETWHLRVSYDHPINNYESNQSRLEAVLRVNLPF